MKYTFTTAKNTGVKLAHQSLWRKKWFISYVVTVEVLYAAYITNMIFQGDYGPEVTTPLALFAFMNLVLLLVYIRVRRISSLALGKAGTKWTYSAAEKELHLKSDLIDSKVKYEVFDQVEVTKDFIFLRFKANTKMYSALPLPQDAKITAFLQSKIK